MTSRSPALVRSLPRRALARLLGVGAFLAALPRPSRAAMPLRVGYQKSGALLVLKGQRALEERLGPQGVTVTWHEFPAGPPLLEALNAGSIDFGATGDTPPLFAQAAGADLLYVAYQPVPGRSSAILVRQDGPVRTLADLKGRTIAFTKGSSAHNVAVRVVQHAGLQWGDVRPVFLAPSDAAAAFRQGAVDAWSIWDPFYAIAEADPTTRVLTTAEGIAPSNSFFLARRALVREQPAVVQAVVAEIAAAARWIEGHQDDLARLMARETGVPEGIQRVAAARGNYDVGLMTDAVAAQQQSIADTFHQLRILPRPLRVRDAVWTPTS